MTINRKFAINRFGDPRSALDISHITDYEGVRLHYNKEYYKPPVPILGLIQLMKASPVHGPLPFIVAKMLMDLFIDNDLIDREEMEAFAIDYKSTGNAYLQLIKNKAGVVIGLEHLPAVNIRRLIKKNRYCQIKSNGEIIKFKEGEVWHLKDYDPEQNIYGLPYWYGAVQSILLAEDARLFPRRFFGNGAHTGFILATSGLETEEEKAVKEVVEGTKGILNFSSIHIGLPEGKVDDVIKLIDVGDLSNKIEFKAFFEYTTKEILAAWGIRSELAGQTPESPGGSGDLSKIFRLNYQNIVKPFQNEIKTLNKHLPARHQIRFKPPEFLDSV